MACGAAGTPRPTVKSLLGQRFWALLGSPGPMECGLTNPARAGRQQRQFALHPPWSPWLFFKFGMQSAECGISTG